MKCYESKSDLSVENRKRAHSLNFRYFDSCPCCDDLDKLPQTRKVIREGIKWRFWK